MRKLQNEGLKVGKDGLDLPALGQEEWFNLLAYCTYNLRQFDGTIFVRKSSEMLAK